MRKKNQITPIEKEIITALAKYDLSVRKTASGIFLHENTIRYHVKMIKENTGFDPTKFYELIQLLRRIRGVSCAK